MQSVVTSHASDTADLVGQVADEFLKAVEAGSQPEVAEYAARHPEIAAILRDVLPALTLMNPAHSNGESNGHAAEDLTDKTLGDFRLVREIGRGGMGVVYEAEQISLGRTVALKILPFAAMLDARQLARFRNEARAAAVLHHTNIVPVYSVGCERGVHFYAMQYIKGESLARIVEEIVGQGSGVGGQISEEDSEPTTDWVAGAGPKGSPGELPPHAARTGVSAAPPTPATRPPTPDSRSPTSDQPPAPDTVPIAHALLSTARSTSHKSYFRNIAELGIQAAEALDYAHEQGVIHRDIKPANLLLDDTSRLWIADFGLARLETDAGMTMTGDLVGTLRYMSPEQALAKRVVVDHRTDIYSLGVTLYELLALRPAFDGADRHKLLKQIAFDDPPALRKLNRQIPVELETIVEKAIRKNPTDRYATAGDLAEDLRSFLQNKPIKAKPPTRRERLVKWSTRHPTTLLSTTIVAATLAVVLTVAAFLINAAKKNEQGAHERAEKQTELALRTLNVVVSDIQTRLAGVPGTDEVRKGLLTTAVDGLKDVNRNMGSPGEADLASMRNHITLGTIYLDASISQSIGAAGREGVAVPVVTSQTKTSQAQTKWLDYDSDPIDALIASVRTTLVSDTDIAYDAGLEQFQIGAEIGRQILNRDPSDVEAGHELVHICWEMAVPGARSNVGVDPFLQRGMTLCEGLLSDDPHDYIAKNMLANLNAKSGDFVNPRATSSNAFHSTSKNMARLQKAIQIYQSLIDEDPANAKKYRANAEKARSSLGDCYLSAGNFSAAHGLLQQAYERALRECKELQGDQSKIFNATRQGRSFAMACLGCGDVASARIVAEKIVEISRASGDDPKPPFFAEPLLFAHGTLARVSWESEDFVAARREATKVIDAWESLNRALPNPRSWALNTLDNVHVSLAILELLSDQQLEVGNLAAARDGYQTCAKTSHFNYLSDPLIVQSWYTKLGNAELRLGNVAAARDAMNRAIELGAGGKQFELFIAESGDEYEQLGDLCTQAGSPKTADLAFQKALDIAQAKLPDSRETRRSTHALVRLCEKLGDSKLRLSLPDGDIRDEYQRAVDLGTELVQHDPRNRQSQRAVAIAHLRLAILNQQSRGASAARDEYRRALTVFLKLGKDDPKNAAAQAELAYCYGECGYLQQATEEFPSAIRCLEKGIAILEKMRDAELLGDEPKYQIWLVDQQTNLDICMRSQLAIDDFESAAHQWPDDAPEYLALRARVFARHGRLADAAAAAEKLAALEPLTAANLYHAAEAYTLCLIQIANSPATASPEVIAQKKLYWSRARELLRQAFDLWAAPKPQAVARG